MMLENYAARVAALRDGVTPGPWSNGVSFVGKRGANGFVRHICEKIFDDGQGNADARLIAAAPELLDIIDALIAECRRLVGDRVPTDTPHASDFAPTPPMGSDKGGAL